jgi:hypothetical protein
VCDSIVRVSKICSTPVEMQSLSELAPVGSPLVVLRLVLLVLLLLLGVSIVIASLTTTLVGPGFFNIVTGADKNSSVAFLVVMMNLQLGEICR